MTIQFVPSALKRIYLRAKKAISSGYVERDEWRVSRYMWNCVVRDQHASPLCVQFWQSER